MVRECKEQQKVQPARTKGKIRRPPRDPPKSQRIEEGNDVTDELLSSEVADPKTSHSAESQQIFSDILKIVHLVLKFSLLLHHRELIVHSQKKKFPPNRHLHLRRAYRPRPDKNSHKVTFFPFFVWRKHLKIKQKLPKNQNRLAFFLTLDLFKMYIGLQGLKKLKYEYDQEAKMKQQVERKLMENHPGENHSLFQRYIEQYDRGMEAFGLYLQENIKLALQVYWGQEKCKRTDTLIKAKLYYNVNQQDNGEDPNQPYVSLKPDKRRKANCLRKKSRSIKELPTEGSVTMNYSLKSCSQNDLDEEKPLPLQFPTEDPCEISQSQKLLMMDSQQIMAQYQRKNMRENNPWTFSDQNETSKQFNL